MTATDPKLVFRAVGWQVVFSLLLGILAAWLGPRLLLLRGAVEEAATTSLVAAIGGGGIVAWLSSWWALRRHRFVLRALSIGSRVEPYEMAALNREILRVTGGWIAAPLVGLVATATLFRPAILDAATALSVALFGVVMVAASSLPLHVLVRAAFLRAIELADPGVMREVVEIAEGPSGSRQSLGQRLVAALVTPTVFVAVGSSLVTTAHVVRADERQREETARALARAALESEPGEVAGAGLQEARARAAEVGFSAMISPAHREYQIQRMADGMIELTAPLNQGSASVRFSGSTVPVLTPEFLLVAVLAILAAGLLGVLIGRELGRDLAVATKLVRELSEGEPNRGLGSPRHFRFRVVADLGVAIERLAARFRVFASAQQQAIESREAATRTRGLFFASVSHDLKSPLNAILGFTELVRQVEPLNSAQRESLDLVDRRARELLALIETILDAARVEAGQLVLMREPVELGKLLSEAVAKGYDLGGESPFEVRCLIEPDLPDVTVDWVRMSRAVATFIGHALRTADSGPIELLGSRAGDAEVEVDVLLPGRQSGDPLDDLLGGRKSSVQIEQRGLALGLGLARSVVELHGGRVRAEDRGQAGRAFTIRLPVGGQV
jgi:signal transduction histidine kinase